MAELYFSLLNKGLIGTQFGYIFINLLFTFMGLYLFHYLFTIFLSILINFPFLFYILRDSLSLL